VDIIIISWCNWIIAHLALINNHSLTNISRGSSESVSLTHLSLYHWLIWACITDSSEPVSLTHLSLYHWLIWACITDKRHFVGNNQRNILARLLSNTFCGFRGSDCWLMPNEQLFNESVIQAQMSQWYRLRWASTYICNMNALFSFDLFMVYIPECKQQLRTMK
jgi:hypothetical protein